MAKEITITRYTPNEILNQIRANEVKSLYETDSEKVKKLQAERLGLIKELSYVSQIYALTEKVDAIERALTTLGIDLSNYSLNKTKYEPKQTINTETEYLSEPEIYQHLIQGVRLPDEILKKIPLLVALRSDIFEHNEFTLLCEGTKTNRWYNVLCRNIDKIEHKRGVTYTLYDLSKIDSRVLASWSQCGKITADDIRTAVATKFHINIE